MVPKGIWKAAITMHTEIKQYSMFDKNTRAPHPLPPPNTCDGQFHIFGSYPPRPGAAYFAPEATITEALRMHKALGIERGVIVQSTAYGTDHRALLEALAIAGPNYRACGIVNESVSDSELLKLHEAGVRGARFNFNKMLNIFPQPEEFARTVARVEELGWYIKLHCGANELVELAPLFDPLTCTVVVDHMGRPEFAKGLKDPRLLQGLEFMKRPNWWMLVSNGDRRSQAGYPWDDAIPHAQAYIAAAPDRCIWATDWPHPLHTGKVPNDAELLELFYRYTSDGTLRRKILVDNPAVLFGFST
jgi:predicted TIM-barrel fold metal-dependent hydrolase